MGTRLRLMYRWLGVPSHPRVRGQRLRHALRHRKCSSGAAILPCASTITAPTRGLGEASPVPWLADRAHGGESARRQLRSVIEVMIDPV